uniref:Enoyl reductase (ER) domain-containing protein n=1 Tax=Chlamydomonas euryale TaxID=1486919 RepID=A0A7R9V375_9CHLO|mmetsp:Transcript_15713/g.46368  ORF Transcript_15713/g.46368 Transcript_15713/m.46368 type:complete len:566 (+) Transcript_15713:1150-2847(+)
MAPRSSALVTGAAAGIGAALARSLAARGYALTLLDLHAPGLEEVAAELRRKHGDGVAVRTARLDVTDATAQAAAFAAHVDAFGGLDVACLNAGIAEQGVVLEDRKEVWQRTVDVNLTAVMTGTQAAAAAMKGRGGTILAVASAGAFFPMPAAPAYAASKAGVLNFVRSQAVVLARPPYKVALHCVCPEFVDTALVRNVIDESAEKARRLMGSTDVKLLSAEFVAESALSLLDPGTPTGTALLIRQNGTLMRPRSPHGGSWTRPVDAGSSSSRGGGGGGGSRGSGGGVSSGAASADVAEPLRAARAAWAASDWPASFRKVQVVRLSTAFRDAVQIVASPLPPPGGAGLPPGTLLLRRAYVGINASDINYTSGRYYGSKKAAEAKLPFDAGFESVSVVAAVGAGTAGFAVGDCAATLTYDGFAEWSVLPAKRAIKVPRASADVVALLTSGLTASIALEESARLQKGETVLVTAAAGGTGQFALQLAKLAGCHVVATAGGPDKAAMLRRLGADRVVDYKSEDLKTVLRREYPRGVDVVYEGVGGSMFDAALSGLADRGRLLVIGMMSA